MKRTFNLALSTLSFLFFCNLSFARHLENREGYGLTLHPFNNTPCISYKSHWSKYQSMVALVGFNTSPSVRTLVVGAKIYQNAHLEENVNFFFGLGGYFLNEGASGSSTASGFEFHGLLGSEFFFSGLPNLGFTLETGVGIRTPNQVSFFTIGNGFFGTSVHYYF